MTCLDVSLLKQSQTALLSVVIWLDSSYCLHAVAVYPNCGLNLFLILKLLISHCLQFPVPAHLLGDATRFMHSCALQPSCPRCAPVWDRRKHRARKLQARRTERNCQHRNPMQVQRKPCVVQHPSRKQHLSLIKIMQRGPVAGGKGKCRSAKQPYPMVRYCWPSHMLFYRESSKAKFLNQFLLYLFDLKTWMLLSPSGSWAVPYRDPQ